jgi:IS30 family transposase
MRVSHETIYRNVFIQAHAVLKKQLMAHLHRRRTLRRSRLHANNGSARGQILEALLIRGRPARAEDRAVPGHWEGDLLLRSGQTRIATLVERKSRFVILAKVPNGETSTVVSAVTRRVRKLPKQLRRSLMWDRGPKMTCQSDSHSLPR